MSLKQYTQHCQLIGISAIDTNVVPVIVCYCYSFNNPVGGSKRLTVSVVVIVAKRSIISSFVGISLNKSKTYMFDVLYVFDSCRFFDQSDKISIIHS